MIAKQSDMTGLNELDNLIITDDLIQERKLKSDRKKVLNIASSAADPI